MTEGVGQRLAETRADSPWRLRVAGITLAFCIVIVTAAGMRANQINCYRARDTRAVQLKLFPLLHPHLQVPAVLRKEQLTCHGLFPEDH